MQKKIKKAYPFALKTAFYIATLITFIVSVMLFSLGAANWIWIFALALISFFVSFYIVKSSVEKFTFNHVKEVYDDLTFLRPSESKNQNVTSNMEMLTKEIDKYAKDRKLEFETLQIREAYRKEFLGNVSHELKTPLFTVQGYLLTLINGAVNDGTVRDKYLNNANKGVERLIYIVRDLDMITKLEVGDLSLNLETFDIIALIKSVFELFEMKASKKRITLTFDRKYKEPILVLADKERIEQVLTNLVVNSIKYGSQQGTTEISVENLVKNKIIVRITDNGEGIEKKHIPRLFERFYRVDKSGSRKEGGSGLGLAIVKHIIEAHKEKIYVESQFKIGSEFSFTLEKSE